MKKILFVNNWLHFKNNISLRSYKNIELTEIEKIDMLDHYDLSKFDCVYSPGQPIDVNKYPNTLFIFGPHFSVFPELSQMNLIRGPNSVYIQPSDWASKTWENSNLCFNIKQRALPFGVDTERFKNIHPLNKRDRVFIYYKYRDPQLLNAIKSILSRNSINYSIFSCNAKYDETTYIEYLKHSKYGIWLGCHESQGFALEEALSCDVPLIVWNVRSMNEEYRSNYQNIPATSIPYWDERCGEVFYNLEEFASKMPIFLSKLSTYKPREFVVQNLSMEVCEQKLINLINESSSPSS
jgi:hypothetical protein